MRSEDQRISKGGKAAVQQTKNRGAQQWLIMSTLVYNNMHPPF